ncbi:MAG: TPM domain-containing protein, partial [Pseudomonadota bacterium]
MTGRMRGLGRLVGALACLIVMLPALALAQPKFPPLTGRVVDDANLLSASAEQELTGELATLEQTTGHQVVVATLPSLQGYEIEEYGYQLLRTWGVGRKDQDDGIILIVAPNERAVRIEVGYGLEPVMTDALSSLILQRAVLPAFKAGNYEQGIVAGTREIIKQVGLPPEEAKAAAAQAEARRAAEVRGSDDANPFVVIFSIFVFLWVLSGIMRLFGGRRAGGLWWLLPFLISNSSRGGGSGWSSGGGGGWSSGGGGGGFS